ncbi:hypothetical protein M0802_009793 [Mischocyttarus mexicanus]|nr:hypothetical protein M0802_009793 [Mischocyttarus mexicanus]
MRDERTFRRLRGAWRRDVTCAGRRRQPPDLCKQPRDMRVQTDWSMEYEGTYPRALNTAAEVAVERLMR